MLVRRILTGILITVIYVAGLAGPVNPRVTDDKVAYDMLAYYIDLVRSGNHESALGMWAPSALTRAGRLGIEYDGITIKADCNSPVINDLGRVKDLMTRGIKTKGIIDSGLVRLKYVVLHGTEEIETYYYARRLGDDFWFVFSQDCYAGEWPVIETEYFRFHINPDMMGYYSPVGTKALDRFVENTADRIKLDSERRKLLAEQKIDYYFCDGENEVRKITGLSTRSHYDRASDALITADFPDFYQVSKLLVDFRLQHRSYFGLPVVEEGLAIYLGGRWQRSGDVIIDFGEYILDFNLTSIDSILTKNEPAGETLADITYPIDACLADFLIARLGIDRYLDLYKDLCGDIEAVEKIDTDQIKSIVAGAAETDWETFKADFTAYFTDRHAHGGFIYPGRVDTDRTLIDEGGINISVSDKWLQVTCSGPADTDPGANILIDRDRDLQGKNSRLFEEQYKNRQVYDGYRFGIKMDKNEIGLYDYGANQLKAKYVVSFDPDPKYYDADRNEVTAYFDIGLLGENLPDFDDYKILD